MDPADVVQRPHRRRTCVPRRPNDPVDGRGRRRDRGGADDTARRRGTAPEIVCVHGGPTWNWGAYFSDSEPNAVLLASAGYACLMPNPRGSIGRGHAFNQGVIGDGGGIDYRDIMAGVDHVIAEGIAESGPSGYRGPVLRRVHGGVGGGSDRSVRRGRRDVGGLELRVVPPDLRGVVVRPRDPAGGVVRSLEPVRGTIAGDACAPVYDADVDPAGGGGPVHPLSQADELFTAIAESGHRGRARGVSARRPCAAGAGHALDAIRRTQEWFDRHL